MIKNILLVGLGGGVGSILRYLTSVLVDKYFQSLFPWATFVVNIIGCLIIGVLLGFFERQQLANPEMKFLFITGFCGGYTTFSAFAAENFNLMQSGQTWIAILYIATSVLIGVFSVWLGMSLIK